MLSGFTFDGTNGYVQIADSTALHPANFTLEGWVRFSGLDSSVSAAPAGVQYIVFKQNTRNYNFEGFSLIKTRVTGGDVFSFAVTSAAGQVAEIFSSTFIATNTWYHVAAVRGPGVIQLYVNGVLESQASVTFGQSYGSLPLYFGTSGQSYWNGRLKGQLDEVSLYDHALSAAEISVIAGAGGAGKCKYVNLTGQPQDQTVVIGSTASFAVTATGYQQLSYQWQFNGANLAGETNSVLVLPNVGPADTGRYHAVVTNVLGSATSSVAQLVVWVIDNGLSNAVLNAAGKPAGPLLISDLGSLTSLDARDRGITSLTGLQAATGLTSLDVSGNSIVSLAPLAALSSLQRLSLDRNTATDLGPLAGLFRLRFLSASDNAIFSAAPIAGLTNLTTLSLDGNRVSDLSFVRTLSGLTSLELEANCIRDLSPLSTLTNLVALGLNRNSPTNFTQLASLTNLGVLSVADVKVADLSFLASLQQLTTLNISSNRFTQASPLTNLFRLMQLESRWNAANKDWTPLAACTNLARLYLAGNALRQLDFASNLTRLEDLGLDQNQVADLSPLTNLTNLRHAALSYNPVTNLYLVANWPQVQALELRRLGVEDLAIVAGDTNLSFLDLADNSLAPGSNLSHLGNLNCLNLDGATNFSFAALPGRPTLTSLSASACALTNAGFLGGLTNLTSLVLDDNQLADFAVASALPRLTVLSLERNPLTSTDPLSNLTQLVSLSLRGNPLTNAGALQGLGRLGWLTSLDLSGSGLTDVSPLAALRQLSSLKLDQNQIANGSALGALPFLEELSVAANQIGDLSFVAGLVHLRSLDLGSNPIFISSGTDPLQAALGSLQHLRTLGLNRLGVDSLPYLSSVGLKGLSVRGNRLSDLGFLAAMPALTSLDLCSNLVAYLDLPPQIQLDSLDARVNRLETIQPLLNLASLGRADVRWNKLDNDPQNAAIVSLLAARGQSLMYSPQLGPPATDATRYWPIAANEYATNRFKVYADGKLRPAVTIQTFSGAPNVIPDTAVSATASGTDVSLVVSPVPLQAANQCDLRITLTDEAGLSTNFTVRVGVVERRLTSIPDASLEGFIRSALSIPSRPLYNVDLLQLTELEGRAANLTDLRGLEWAANLRSLALAGGSITNSAPLSALPGLTNLYLFNAGLKDLGALAHLTNLTRLDLSWNGFNPGQAANLAALTRITDLALPGNNLSNIDFVSGMMGLQNLAVGYNRISSLAPVATLGNLNILAASHNLVTNIDVLGPLINLANLDARVNLLDLSDGSSVNHVIGQLLLREAFVLYFPQRPPTFNVAPSWILQPNSTSSLYFSIPGGDAFGNLITVRGFSRDTNTIRVLGTTYAGGSGFITAAAGANQANTSIQLSATDEVGITSTVDILAAVNSFIPLDGSVLNSGGLVWSNGGAAPWFGQELFALDATGAAQSGTIGSLQQSWLETSVTGPGRLSFWWRVSSEPNYDFLEFYINGALQRRISGEVDWQHQELYVPAGPSTFRWQYSKDVADNLGWDAGWLDQVSYAAGPWLSIGSITNGSQGQFVLTSPTGMVFQVQSSTDARVWAPVQNLAASNSLTPFTAPVDTNSARQFYRIQSPPPP